MDTLKTIHEEALAHLRKLRFESTVIGKIFKNQDPMGYPVETVPVVEDCYRAYRSFVKDKFIEELDSLNRP